MNLFFEKLLWPSLAISVVELIFAQSQPHWFLTTLAFATINIIAFVGFSLVKRGSTAPVPS
jgi:hypothetical protein